MPLGQISSKNPGMVKTEMTHSLTARVYFPLIDLGRACLWYNRPVDCQNQYMGTTEQKLMMMITGAASRMDEVKTLLPGPGCRRSMLE